MKHTKQHTNTTMLELQADFSQVLPTPGARSVSPTRTFSIPPSPSSNSHQTSTSTPQFSPMTQVQRLTSKTTKRPRSPSFPALTSFESSRNMQSEKDPRPFPPSLSAASRSSASVLYHNKSVVHPRHNNPIAILNELCQRLKHETPLTQEEYFPAPNGHFQCRMNVRWKGYVIVASSNTSFRSKKLAKVSAAENLLVAVRTTLPSDCFKPTVFVET